MSVFVVWLLLGLQTAFVRHCHGLHIPQCGSEFIELDMASSNNEITCEDADRNDVIKWSYAGSLDTGVIICPSSEACTDNTFFTATRGHQATSSRLTIRANLTRARALYGDFTLNCSIERTDGTQTDSTSCKIDVVYHAEVRSCSAQFITAVGRDWTASGRCVVSKVFSQRGRYGCVWTESTSGASREIQSSPRFTGSFEEGGVNYTSMTCDFSESLPRVTGTYNYTVVISPGDVQPAVNFNGSSSIVLPKAHTTCPTGYVKEGDNVTCTCDSTDGNPAGSSVWRMPSGSSRLVLNDVKRGNHGDSYICDVKWGSDVVSNTTFTLQVAYGPISVDITGASPFDTNGSRDITLTCTVPGGSNPAPVFQWTRPPSADVIHRAQSYAFRPQRSDDEMQLSCTARNNATSVSRTDTFTVDLNYPPTRDPTLADNSTDGYLYQGDAVTLTCEVEGGKPVSATRLTFACPGQNDSQDITVSTKISSTVTFTSLSRDDHDNVCTCRTRWKTTDWYNKTATRKLFVNSPPSIPTIEAPAGVSQYPFLATASQPATLTCVSTTPGRPAATYTWPVSHGGRQGNDTQGRGTLTFDTVTKEHDGKTVSCRAGNRYTQHRHPVPDGTFALEVYYHPEVNITHVTDHNVMQCSITTSDTSQCLVTEGQKFHFRCTAVSNPAPAEFTWSEGRGNNQDLVIESANRTQHTGTYNCSVTTGPGNRSNDQRLPLKGWSAVTVLIKYETSVTSFTLNSADQTNVTVNASDPVTLTCQADGRPSPAMTLTHPNGTQLSSRPQGTPQLQDRVVDVSSNITAQCTDMGLYTCQANNGIGTGQRHHVTVFVQCKPRVPEQEKIPRVDISTGEKQISFVITGFPTPELREVRFYKQRPNSTSVPDGVKENKVHVKFTRMAETSPDVNCQVTVSNITASDSGFFEAVVGNHLGSTSFILEVTTNATDHIDSSLFPVLAVALGTSAAILVIIVTVILVYKCRKGDRKSQARHSERSADHGRAQADMTVNELYGTSGGPRNDADEVMIVNTIYGTSEKRGSSGSDGTKVPGNAYEDVELNSCSNPFEPHVTLTSKTSARNVRSGRKHVPAGDPSHLDGSSLYATVNKASTSDGPPAGTSSGQRQRLGVKPKPAKKMKSGKPKDKTDGKRTTKQDENHLLGSLEYSNINATPLTMSPRQQDGSVYENYAFEKDEVRKDEPHDGSGTRTANEDGLVYTTVAFSEKQLKKAEEPPPEREKTEYAGIDFTRTANPAKTLD